MKPKSLFKTITLLTCLLIATQFSISQTKYVISVTPKPVSVEIRKGSFKINSATKILISKNNDTVFQTAGLLKEIIRTPQAVSQSKKALNNSIFFEQDNNIPGLEAYTLSVSPNHILIKYKTPAGAFYALQTLRQLMPVEIKHQSTVIPIPAVNITDSPKFAWRGLNLDVARHFFPVSFVKKFIETMALYKFNILQLHLTDDQGWRIEIKKYPQLTERGAYRDSDFYLDKGLKNYPGPYMAPDPVLFKEIGGKKMYGGYYSQEDMREIIAFAKLRNVNILPEVDMPGHTGIARSLFPQLSCADGGPISPCSDFSYEFAKNVFSEIAALFPFQYIHIGGDEVDRNSWEKCTDCKTFMQVKGIKNTDELQGYFTREVELFFNSKGKKLIGWDEILEGGVSKTATAMYWRTWVPDNLKDMFKYGNNIVLSPTSHTYLDLQQNNYSLQSVYSYRPVPAYVNKDQQRSILGIQGNLWSEVIPNGHRVEYMAFPRAIALAEIAWSGAGHSKWDEFSQRMKIQYKRLNALNVHYRLPGLEGFTQHNLYVGKGELKIFNPDKDDEVRYTIDGTMPDRSSPLYTNPVQVTRPVNFTIGLFRPDGELNEVYNADFKDAKYLPAIDVKPVLNGLIRTYYEGSYGSTGNINGKDLVRTDASTAFQIPDKYKAPFATKYAGYIKIDTTGIYTFSLISDDGSVLQIDDQAVVNNDGVHKTEQRSAQIALKKGYHKIGVSFIEVQGDITLNVMCGLEGKTLTPIRPGNLYH